MNKEQFKTLNKFFGFASILTGLIGLYISYTKNVSFGYLVNVGLIIIGIRSLLISIQDRLVKYYLDKAAEVKRENE